MNRHNPPLLGYADRLSARPGEVVGRVRGVEEKVIAPNFIIREQEANTLRSTEDGMCATTEIEKT